MFKLKVISCLWQFVVCYKFGILHDLQLIPAGTLLQQAGLAS
jgi:hypothetical protein